MRQSALASLPTGRIVLVLLAIVPAAMAYPWQSPRERWVLGIAVAVVIVLLAWWRGLFATTMLRRRVAVLRRNRGWGRGRGSATDVRATALLRITASDTDPDVLPLPLIARYLDCYGIHADAVRITSRDSASDTAVPQRDTWIGLTLSAAGNLAALQARSSKIPLHETAEVAVRRLADHLREAGWAASIVDPDDVPDLFARATRETWRGIRVGSAEYVAAYRVKAGAELPDTLAVIRSYPARETWTALEIAGGPGGRTLAVACAFRTDGRPGRAGPLAGLTPQAGNQRPALATLHPSSVQRLDAHSELPADLLTRLRWSSTAQRQARARHAAVS